MFPTGGCSEKVKREVRISDYSEKEGQTLRTFVVHLAVHGGAGGLAVRLRRLEVNVRADGSVQQRLGRPVVVAQGRLRVVGAALHQAAQGV